MWCLKHCWQKIAQNRRVALIKQTERRERQTEKAKGQTEFKLRPTMRTVTEFC